MWCYYFQRGKYIGNKYNFLIAQQGQQQVTNDNRSRRCWSCVSLKERGDWICENALRSTNWINLEDFQKKALHQLLIDDKDLRLLPISAATGFGKSLIFTSFSSAYDLLNSVVLPVVVGLLSDLNAAAEVDCKATVIVTPLISLLNDQIANLAKFVCIFSLSFSRHV